MHVRQRRGEGRLLQRPDLRPVLRCVQDYIEPLRKKLMWGFDLPYMMTGLLNQHPRAAIKFKSSGTKGDIVKFYDSVIEEAFG